LHREAEQFFKTAHETVARNGQRLASLSWLRYDMQKEGFAPGKKTQDLISAAFSDEAFKDHFRSHMVLLESAVRDAYIQHLVEEGPFRTIPFDEDGH
jgi:hypothetical protein